MAIITEMDKYTIKQIEAAMGILESRMNNMSLSEATRKRATTHYNKYKTQKGKTYNVYNKYKSQKKYKHLQSMSKSALSVKKIYEAVGKSTAEAPNGGNGFWGTLLQHPIENAAMVVGAGMVVGGVLSTTATINGLEATLGTHLKNAIFGNSELQIVGLFGKIATLNPATLVIIGGSALLAGMILKKALRARSQARAAEKAEIQEAIEKDTARDHAHIEKSLTDASLKSDLVNQAATGPEESNEIFKYLISVAANNNNSPDVIQAANDIIAAARVARAAAFTQAKVNTLATSCNAQWQQADIEVVPGTKITRKQALVDVAVYDRAKRAKDASEVALDASKLPATCPHTAIDKEFNLSDPTIKAKIAGLADEAACLADPAMQALIAKGTNVAEKAAIEKYIKEAYKKAKAGLEYESIKASGQISESGGNIQAGSVTATNRDKIYYTGLLGAARDSGLIPDGIKWDPAQPLTGQKPEVQNAIAQVQTLFGKGLKTIEQNMLNEFDAGRGGMVK